MNWDLDQIKEQAVQAFDELLDSLEYPPNSVFVLGCSSSEICGGRIGKASNEEVGAAIVTIAQDRLAKKGYCLAVQCCEHLNRAIVIEKEVADRQGLDAVTVVPVLHAGGACAMAAYQQMKDPQVVEHVVAVAGIDIGDTFIGMHIKHVAVPVRLKVKEIGSAHVTAAKSRPKLIGGERACYHK